MSRSVSERSHLFLHLARGPRIAPEQRCEITLVLKRQDALLFEEHLTALRNGTAEPMSREAFGQRFGSASNASAAVETFADQHGLTVVERAPARRSVILSASAAQLEAAFAISLYHYSHDSGTFRGIEGELVIPKALEEHVTAVLGFDNRPQAKPHFRLATRAATSYTPLQVAQRYNFPAGDGAGQTIGIIELGGGYQPADLASYFATIGLPVPEVTAISVDGATNLPSGSAEGPDGEVMLDIEVAGAIAPKASIAVYFAPNTDAGFTDAITRAVHDATAQPSVLSISWGGPESSWTSAAIKAMDAALADAVAIGLTVCIASGDNGASDGVTDGATHVDFPASSPHALACGGTSLATHETVWNDGASGGASGGGISTVFPVPTYQVGLQITPTGQAPTALTMRGVPDVAGDADPETGYKVRVDGTDTVIGGTSAVAPLWAGLIARLNASAGKPLGSMTPLLYRNPGSCNDITKGNNNGFSAGVGWDACTGLGSPNGSALTNLFTTPLKKKHAR